MQDGAGVQSSPALVLDDLPRPNALPPTCKVGLLEVAAKYQFDVASIERAWFSHSFLLRPPDGMPRIGDDGRTLNFDLSCGPNARAVFSDKLAFHYGLGVRTSVAASFEELLSELDLSLREGVVPLTTFDAHYAPQIRIFEHVHALNYVLIKGLDFEHDVIHAVDAHVGALSVEFEAFRRCFQHVTASGREFKLLRCVRVERPERVSAAELIRADVLSTVSNLRSHAPYEGLNALDSTFEALRSVIASDPRPFVMTNLSRFHRERHGAHRGLQHWREVFPSAAAEIERLAGPLRRAGGAWYRMHMTMWHTHDTLLGNFGQEFVSAFERVRQFEAELADRFEGLAGTMVR